MQTIFEIRDALQSGTLQAGDVVAECLQAIRAQDERVGAFLQVYEESAKAAAAAIEGSSDEDQPLAGIPVALKDNICESVGTTTCGSRMLRDYRSPYEATVVSRLREAGAIIIGKTNLDEFAMGGSTENSALAETNNPWDRDRVPGGSSGGSAAAVAAGMVPVALGSDTGGSIRQPASFCGVVGLKPTYGRVSRYGLVAFGSSLDQIGPLTRTVADAALVLQIIAGHDFQDGTSAAVEVPDYVAAIADSQLAAQSTLRIGVPRDQLGDGVAPDVVKAIEAALQELERRGATLVDVELPHVTHGIAAYYLIATAEAASNLARFDGVHFGHRTEKQGDIITLYSESRDEALGDEVMRRIMLGTFALSEGYDAGYYDKASRIRRLLQQDFANAFEQVDAIAGPTCPTTAFRRGEKSADPLQMYLADQFTVAANLTGLPALSVPCGHDRDGLPIGLQLTAPAFAESLLLQVARRYERETNWVDQNKPVGAAI